MFLIYGKECVILLTACLQESRSESRTTIPQDDGRKEGKLIVICSCMNLSVGKRVHVASDSHETLKI